MGTKIEWCEETWNPVIGCTKVSEGCLNCYAERMAYRQVGAERKRKQKRRYYTGTVDKKGWTGLISLRESVLDKPLHWRRPRRIFVCSMGDLFHESVPFEFICRVFDVIRQCERHTFLILTKRPKRPLGISLEHPNLDWPIAPNLWLGVTIENQANIWRAYELFKTPAAVNFWSIEPMLSEITFGHFIPDWVIVGCESGPKRRECKLEWVRDIVSQCQQADVPVFVKQLHIDGKLVKDISKFPKDLQIRQWPERADNGKSNN